MKPNSVPKMVLVAIILAHLLHHSTIVLLSPLFPFIRDQISINYSQIGILGMVISLTLVGGQLLIGWGVDRKGPRLWILWGLILPIMGFWIIATASDYLGLLIGQLVIGIGLAGYHPAGFTVIRQYFSSTHRGRVAAIHSMGGSIGIAVTPFLAVALVYILGTWRLSVLAFMLPNFVVMGIIWWALRAPPKPIQMNNISSTDNPNPVGTYFGVYLLVTGGRYGVLRVLETFIPIYATDIFQSEILFISGIFSMFNLMGAIITLYGGKMADQYGRKTLLFASTALSILPLTLILFAPSVEMFALGIVLLSITFFIGHAADAAYLTEIAPETTQGRIFGIILSIQMIAAAGSSVLFGILGDVLGLETGITLLITLLLVATVASYYLSRNNV